MRRVLLLGGGSLLDDGVESLLNVEGDLQVSRIAYVDEDNFLGEITQFRPDVIVISESEELNVDRIDALLHRLLDFPTLRVIVVRLIDNTLNLYEKQHVTLSQSDDLLALIRRGSVGSSPG